MNSEMQQLAQRVVACKGWRWVRGCPIAPYAGEEPERGAFALVVEHPADGRSMHAFITPEDGLGVMEIGVGDLPDLTNPATLGCLLALVREAWGDEGAHAWCDYRTGQWAWMAGRQSCFVHGGPDGYSTEAHALVAALEAAP